jgi:hypothetical protein
MVRSMPRCRTIPSAMKNKRTRMRAALWLVVPGLQGASIDGLQYHPAFSPIILRLQAHGWVRMARSDVILRRFHAWATPVQTTTPIRPYATSHANGNKLPGFGVYKEDGSRMNGEWL